MFHSQSTAGAKASGVASGDLLGGLQRTQQAELLELWANLSKDQQKLVIELARLFASRSDVQVEGNELTGYEHWNR